MNKEGLSRRCHFRGLDKVSHGPPSDAKFARFPNNGILLQVPLADRSIGELHMDNGTFTKHKSIDYDK